MPPFVPTGSTMGLGLWRHLLIEGLSISSDGSRWLAERAQKGTAHSFPVCKARFARHHVDRMCTLLQHQPCRLYTKIFNCLGW